MDQAARSRDSEEPIPSDLSPSEYLDRQWEGPTDAEGAFDGVRSVPLRLHRLEKPSIAAVNGYAMGLGMGDRTLVRHPYRIRERHVLGDLHPARAHPRRRLLLAATQDDSGWATPCFSQYTGDRLDAQEALRLGIVSRVIAHEDLLEKTMELATRLAQGPTYGMALTKRLVQRSLETDFEESMRLSGVAQEIARRTDDHREGARAFVEKRKPEFTGR